MINTLYCITLFLSLNAFANDNSNFRNWQSKDDVHRRPTLVFLFDFKLLKSFLNYGFLKLVSTWLLSTGSLKFVYLSSGANPVL